jgi:putative transposase
MSRLARLVMPGHLHLVVQRGRGEAPVFRDAADARVYLDALAQSARDCRVAVHGFGLMPGEARLLVTPGDVAGLGALMQSVGRRYVRAHNLRHAVRGTPWEGRFRSTVVESPAYFVDALRFVEGLEAGLSDRSTALVSSAAHHAGEQRHALVTEHEAFWSLGNTPFDREAAYRRAAESPLAPETLARLSHAALKGWALGSPAFAEALARATGRRSSPLPRGRPRKSASTSADERKQ